MFQNPLIQTVLLLLGAYSTLTMAAKYSPADKVVLGLAVIFVVVIWMSRYSRDTLYQLHRQPGLASLIDLICQIAKEQAVSGPALQAAPRSQTAARSTAPQQAQPSAPPVSHSTAAPPKPESTDADRLLLRYDGDFATAGREIRQRIIGHDDAVRAVIDQIRRNVQLRMSSAQSAVTSPIGVFVFVGQRGLGKRSLAIELGSRMYRNGGIAIVDVSDPNIHAGLLVAEAQANPFTTFILDRFETATERLQNDLLSIVVGTPQTDPKTGVKVSFRHTLFFFLIQGSAERLPAPSRQAGGTGQTMLVNTLSDDLHIDKRLAWSIHGVLPFLLPPSLKQAEVIAAIMENACRKYNLQLGYVEPAVLAREVEMATQAGGFELAPARVEKLLNGRILEAMSAHQQSVAVTASAMQTQI